MRTTCEVTATERWLCSFSYIKLINLHRTILPTPHHLIACATLSLTLDFDKKSFTQLFATDCSTDV